MHRLIAILALLALSVPASAQEAPKEELPPPRVIPLPSPGNLFLQSPPPVHGTLDVWTNYAVDSTGRWRPRVIAAPFGSYYFYNSQFYPWTTTHPRAWKAVTHD